MTLFRSAFLYFASKILRILHVKFIVPSDSMHLLTYTLINGYSGLNLFSVKGLKSYVLTSTIVADHPLNGPSSPKMMFLENLNIKY